MNLFWSGVKEDTTLSKKLKKEKIEKKNEKNFLSPLAMSFLEECGNREEILSN